MPIYDFPIKYLNGKPFDWSIIKGRPCIICNIATKCGLAEKNFTNLNRLKGIFPDLEILVFPSNTFKQEIDDNEKIEEQIKKINEQFFVCERVNLWKNPSPLFKYLCDKKRGFIFQGIEWNFTKFLVDGEGNFVERFGPTKVICEEEIKQLLP